MKRFLGLLLSCAFILSSVLGNGGIVYSAASDVPKNPTDDSLDIPISMYTVSAGSTQPGNSPERAIDGDEESFWEVVWDIGYKDQSVFWYMVELPKAIELQAVRQLPRFDDDYEWLGTANGFITGYRIETSINGETWETAAEGTWVIESGWKIAQFDKSVTAKYVRLTATNTFSSHGDNTNLSMVEIRLVSASEVVEPTPEVTEAPQPTEEVTPMGTPEVKEDVTTIFDDVFEDWYTDYVQYVYDNGLMTGIKGTKHFEPNANITKAQVAQVLYNMEGQPEVDVENSKVFDDLSDVCAAEWYTAAVAWAYETGVITGDLNEKKFFPNDDITREQLALMMFRYAKFKEYDTSATSDFTGLANAENIANWAMEGVSWSVGVGLIRGIEKDGAKDLAPQGNATRAQVAAILQELCEIYE